MSIRRLLKHGLTSAVGRARLAVGVGLVLGSLASSAAPALGASTVTVQVGGSSFTFTPQNQPIQTGDTIHWNWAGTHHSVTSGAVPGSPNGQFDSGVINATPHTLDVQFNHPGVYHYFCQIHYALGMVGTITVTGGPDPAPTGSFTAATTAPLAGSSVSFDAGGSSPSSDGDTLDTYAWDFGDGTPGVTTTTPTTSHTYTTVGAHTVSLTVTDSGSATSPAVTQQMNVQPAPDLPPTARFKASPSKPVVGHAVSFDASASTATVGQAIASYRWDFGDGATQMTASPKITHSYGHAGPVSVKLVVVDGLGMTSSPSTVGLTIGLPPPVASKLRLGAASLCVRRTSTCVHTSTSVRFSLSRAVSVKLVIKRGSHKVKQRTIKGKAGKNSFKLSAAGLRAGTYKLVLTPNGGRAVTAHFRIRRP